MADAIGVLPRLVPWNRKPTQLPRINQSNPYSKGLRFCYLPDYGPLGFDVVSRALGVVGGAGSTRPVFGASEHGIKFFEDRTTPQQIEFATDGNYSWTHIVCAALLRSDHVASAATHVVAGLWADGETGDARDRLAFLSSSSANDAPAIAQTNGDQFWGGQTNEIVQDTWEWVFWSIVAPTGQSITDALSRRFQGRTGAFLEDETLPTNTSTALGAGITHFQVNGLENFSTLPFGGDTAAVLIWDLAQDPGQNWMRGFASKPWYVLQPMRKLIPVGVAPAGGTLAFHRTTQWAIPGFQVHTP